MNNFTLRAITGALYVAALVGSLLGGPIAFTCFFTLVAALCVWEFCTVLNAQLNATINRFIATVGAASFMLAMSQAVVIGPSYQLFLPFVATLLYILISELYRKDANPLKNWGFAFAAQLYITLPLSMIFLLAYRYDAMSNTLPYSYVLPLSIFLFLWTSDTGAYLCGSALSKYFPAKLFERISPNKSWVGSIGGGVLCLAVAAALWHFFPERLPLWQWMGLGLVVCIFGTWGDLVESLFKRQLGIKDSGNILPGHGGMLDRFDSALLAIPAGVIFLLML
ncbi:MAG: phosphatidate cytidylyltransferase [Bacteroidaceae bacterium]|nr:phosphatidate cytidylyltransferase [Bacteroidaceae bacterium]